MPMVLPNGQNIRSINKSTEEAYRNNEHQTPGDEIRIPSPAVTMTENSPRPLEMLRYTQPDWL